MKLLPANNATGQLRIVSACVSRLPFLELRGLKYIKSHPAKKIGGAQHPASPPPDSRTSGLGFQSNMRREDNIVERPEIRTWVLSFYLDTI